MKLSFNIQPLKITTTNADLYFMINAHGLSYIILDSGSCVALVIYNFNATTPDDTAAGFIHQVIDEQQVLKQKFKKVHIIYGYTQSILIPHQFMNDKDNSGMLEMVYGEASERINRTDFMHRQAIHNVYRVPAVVEKVVTRYFGFAESTHLCSLLADVVKEAGNHLYCIFSTGQLRVMLIREGKLQSIINYSYKTPEDVAYHLLNLCDSFEISTNNILVRLSGMIDTNSPLFNELFKYFEQLEFGILPGQYYYPEEINQYPAHYFSHIFAIAACV